MSQDNINGRFFYEYIHQQPILLLRFSHRVQHGVGLLFSGTDRSILAPVDWYGIIYDGGYPLIIKSVFKLGSLMKFHTNFRLEIFL